MVLSRGSTACVIAASALVLGCRLYEWPCPTDGGVYSSSEGCPDAFVPRDTGPRPDAGRDGGRADAGRDAAPDVGTDANVDGGPTDPVWVALPDLPADCVIERAEHPERLPSLTWTSCGTGCLRANQGGQFAGFGDAAFRDGRGWLATINGTSGSRAIYKIMPVDGAPIAAWRFSNTISACTVSWGDVAEGRAGVVAHWHDDPSLTTVEERVYVAPIDTLGATTTAEAIVTAPNVGDTRVVDDLAVGSGVAALHISPDASILIERDGVVEFAFGPSGWDAAVEGDHVVWAEAGGPWRLWHWTPETHTQIYYDPGEPISGHLLDQGTLVWTRGADFVDGFATRAELWTSPFTRSPTDVAPRMVHPDAGSFYARFGDGVYLSVRANGLAFSAQLTDLADGRVRMLGVPEPGVACTFAHYVSSTEVLLNCGIGGTSAAAYYYRIDPRTLAYVP